MPRYMVERSFPDELTVPVDAEGAAALADVVANNADADVTWVCSYVSADRTQTFCIYDGPNPDAIRQAAKANSMPIGPVTEVRVLDPYFYTPSESS